MTRKLYFILAFLLLVAQGTWAQETTQWTFTYTGAVQTFTVPTTGYYTLTCYGAQGGSFTTNRGGYGGTSQLNYQLTQGDVLYLYVGGQGGSIAQEQGLPDGGNGGWNGGGKGGTGVKHRNVESNTPYSGGGGGGGATHIATSAIGAITSSSDFTSNHANLLLIAGGGGGGCNKGIGGKGGGAEGEKGFHIDNSYIWNIDWNNGTNSCGKDGMLSSWEDHSCEGCGGGGGGYVGGNTWVVQYNEPHQCYSGAGGSSWGDTTNGTGYTTTAGGATEGGNGKAKITLLFQGSGTSSDPYLISSVDAWNLLADQVNGGTNYSGKYFQQTGDFTVSSKIIGYPTDDTHYVTFNGIYDGNGCTITASISKSDERYVAPFHCIANATIKNVIVTGSVTVSGSASIEHRRHPAGLVGVTDGTCILQNCRVSANVSGCDYMGGLIGHTQAANITITGCVYSGTLTASDTNNTGGLIGWGGDNGGKTYTLTNNLFAGSYSGSGKFHPVGFLYNPTGNTRTVTNTYYMTGLRNVGDNDNNCLVKGLVNKGKFAYSITTGKDVTLSGLSSTTATYDISGITAYAHGINYGGTFYAGNGEEVSLNLSHGDKEGYTFNQYTISGGGSLANPTTNTPTLTMTDANQTINATWTENTATLTDGDDLSALSAWAGKTCTVTYTRSFTAGKPSTVCLPFAYTKKTGDGSFYAFSGIEKVGSEYIATMTEPGTSTLTANTPYLYKAATTGDADFSGTYAIPASITAGSTTSGDWTFKGTYSTIEWTSAPAEPTYGFSAQDANAGIQQGQFVKVGSYVRIKPMRAYLQYNGSDSQFTNARALMTRAAATTSDDTLPETIGVRLISANGEVTAIGTLYTRTGEVSFDSEAWYTLDGKRLNAKPNTKGIYVNNGKKVVIK